MSQVNLRGMLRQRCRSSSVLHPTELQAELRRQGIVIDLPELRAAMIEAGLTETASDHFEFDNSELETQCDRAVGQLKMLSVAADVYQDAAERLAAGVEALDVDKLPLGVGATEEQVKVLQQRLRKLRKVSDALKDARSSTHDELRGTPTD